MLLKRHIMKQFARPTGVLGEAAGRIMARRSSNRIRNARTVEMMQLTPEMRVLEFGCGPGLALVDCARAVTAGGVVGVDHSERMIAQSRNRLAADHLDGRVELVAGGLDALETLAGQFDRVFSLNVIQFIRDKRGFYEKVHGLLNRGGICFTTYQPRLERDARAASASQADSIVENMCASGFDKVGVAQIPAGDVPAICVSGVKRK